MNPAEEWAIGIRVVDKLRNGKHQLTMSLDEASLAVQQITNNLILCGGPTEYFSQAMPTWVPQSSDEHDLSPIDILYGKYDYSSRSIKIFIKRINQDAKYFGANSNELLTLVRIHEYAHAIIHLGIKSEGLLNQLTTFGNGDESNWTDFIDRRNTWFIGFSDELHEFLAQAITYTVLSNLFDAKKSQRLCEVFNSLELKQPNRYKLTPVVKDFAPKADWPLILDASRGDTDTYRDKEFSLKAGLEALICN